MKNATARSMNISLVEALDVALNKGIILCGDLTISLASVDLIFLSLKVLFSSVKTAEKMCNGSIQPRVSARAPHLPPSPRVDAPFASARGQSIWIAGQTNDRCLTVHARLTPGRSLPLCPAWTSTRQGLKRE